MNPSEVLRIVDAIHRDKKIDKEIVFQAIESALVSASRKYHSEEAEVVINIDRKDGSISGHIDGVPMDPEETVGRIGAQTAKQVIIQKIREAERDALHEEYDELIGQMVNGVVHRSEGGATIVTLDNVESILPRSEQIPGESFHANDRVRAVVFEVRKQGSRVKVVLSRTNKKFVERLFEQEIPEITENVIEIRNISREPGYRSKVAVDSSDQRVDCVGACVGVRGNRIKNIVDELAGERIDIVRWSENPQELITNALQPAEVEEVILCQMMGRAIVLVREDQLSLAIGRRGQNVRLASKLCGWDIEIMLREELEEQIERAVTGFSSIDGITDEVAEQLVGEGFLSYDDLSVIETDAMMEMGEFTEEQVEQIRDVAELKAEEAEKAMEAERRRIRDEKLKDGSAQ
ncbi:transcription termination factor NusA [Bremerella sp. JC770]|uniref:transcription termination factor NusA n=1 Tax=Bremerella sp. JC770 TaxID=3232137 RepID=UPI003459204F